MEPPFRKRPHSHHTRARLCTCSRKARNGARPRTAGVCVQEQDQVAAGRHGSARQGPGVHDAAGVLHRQRIALRDQGKRVLLAACPRLSRRVAQGKGARLTWSAAAEPAALYSSTQGGLPPSESVRLCLFFITTSLMMTCKCKKWWCRACAVGVCGPAAGDTPPHPGGPPPAPVIGTAQAHCRSGPPPAARPRTAPLEDAGGLADSTSVIPEPSNINHGV